MIELYLVPAAGLILLAMGLAQWVQGRRIVGGLLGGLGLFLILWIPWLLLQGWLEDRRERRRPPDFKS